MATHNEICAKDRKMFESLLAPKKQHNLNAAQDSAVPLSIILSHTLSQSLCCFLSFHVPEILGMPHWSSLEDLCREHGAMEHPSSSCWQLVAGTFNWNKSLHKICQFVAMHTHTYAHTQLHSTYHARQQPRPLAHYTHDARHAQWLGDILVAIVNTWAFLQLILSVCLPQFSICSFLLLLPPPPPRWARLGSALECRLARFYSLHCCLSATLWPDIIDWVIKEF